MAIPLVKVRYANGHFGWVAATFPPLVAGNLERADDQSAPTDTGAPSVTPPVADPDVPSKSASTDVWRAFGASHGLASEQADNMTRTELVAYFIPNAPQEG